MSWEQLTVIAREAAAEARAESRTVPVACPHDGQPLLAAPDGGVYCPYDGWRP